MRTALILVSLALSGFFLSGAKADDTALPPALSPVSASEVVLADLLYLQRAVIVFADSPNDPAFVRQMELLRQNPGDLIEREVMLITDTAPKPASAIRQKLRPRGFSLVILDKDGSTALRKPLPWETREIARVIDNFPSRIIEMQERMPAGR